jgi:hypothetical protein
MSKPSKARKQPKAQAFDSSLTDYLTGYLSNDPALQEMLRNFSDWPRLARQECERRACRLLTLLSDGVVNAIAKEEVDFAELIGNIPPRH